MSGLLKDYLARRDYVPPTKEEEEIIINSDAEAMRDLIRMEGYHVLAATADELLGEMHQRMLNGQETPDFYKGVYRAITAIFAYPDDRIKQALHLLEQKDSKKGKEEEDEYI